MRTDAELQEFLDLCSATARADHPEDAERTSQGEAGAESARLSWWHLAGYLLLTCVAFPTLFVLCWLPMQLEHLPVEIGHMYTALERLPFMAHGFTLSWQGLGEGPSLWVAAGLCACLSIGDAMTAFRLLCGPSTIAWDLGSMFFALFFASLCTLARRTVDERPVVPVLMHMLGLAMGAVPCMFSCLFYVVVHIRRWTEEWYYFVPIALVWTTMPTLLKGSGKWLWRRGLPAAPALSSLIWIFYCEAVVGCFGFLVFMRTPLSVMVYGSTIWPLLLLFFLRGIERGFRWAPCASTLPLHRASLHLEALVTVIARAAAYSLFVGFRVLQLCALTPAGGTVVRASLISSRQFALRTTDMYHSQKVSLVDLGAAGAGLPLIMIGRAAFNFAASRFWRGGGGSRRAAAAARAAWEGPSGQGGFDSPLSSAPGGEEDSGIPIAARFMVQFRLLLLVCLIFVLTLTKSCTKLVHSFLPEYQRGGLGGEDCEGLPPKG